LISAEKKGEFMTADDAVAAKSKPGPLQTKADCREVFEMETMLTSWLHVYGRLRVEVKAGYAWPRYWSDGLLVDSASGWMHKRTPGLKHVVQPPEKSLRQVVLDVMRAHEAFYQQEFLPAVARWREIAPGEPVPTDKEV
jgi:hypothetical protein